MPFNNLPSLFRASSQAGISVLAVLSLLVANTAGCSKQETPAASTQPAAATTTTAAAPATPAANLPPASPIPASASVDQAISLARAAIGPEDKLNAINSLIMSGTVFDDQKQAIGTVLVIYAKPGLMRTEAHRAKQANLEGSNGVMGWTLDEDINNNKRIAFLPVARETQNNYNTLENLYFYRAFQHISGATVADGGEVQYRGATCRKLSFSYPNGTTYVRYLESATGKLHGTMILPSGTESIEEGAIVVGGVVFPQIITNYDKDGKLTQAIKFEKIGLNPKVDSKIFDLPSLQVITAHAPKPAAATASASANAAPAGSGK